jgi:hypothetical protein
MQNEQTRFDNSRETPLAATRDVTRSALRYFGGKWAIAPWIIEHMPAHRVYVEPFGRRGQRVAQKAAQQSRGLQRSG